MCMFLLWQYCIWVSSGLSLRIGHIVLCFKTSLLLLRLHNNDKRLLLCYLLVNNYSETVTVGEPKDSLKSVRDQATI